MSFLYGYCISGIVPLRSEASDASQQETQLLLGESFEVLAITERWVQIRATTDAYEGWVNRNQVRFLPPDEFERWLHHPKKERSPYRGFYAHNETDSIYVPLGAQVIFDDVTVTLPHGEYEVRSAPILVRQLDVLSTAKQLLGVPYLWGGRTDTGLDCSGYVQLVHQLFGFNPPRNAREQVQIGAQAARDLVRANVGDLVYFGEVPEKITHVGFYLGDGTLLHASGHVKLNNLLFERRFDNPFPFDKRLFERIQFVQPFQALQTQE